MRRIDESREEAAPGCFIAVPTTPSSSSAALHLPLQDDPASDGYLPKQGK